MVKPVVSIKRLVNLSWEELQARLSGKPNFVKVGLPDSVTTTEGDQVRKLRRRGRRRQ